MGWLSTHGFSSPRGREGVVFRSGVLSVSFLVLPLSQSNFVSPGLLWSPCESPDLLLPQSSIIHWHIQGPGSSRNIRTLPDGLWKAGHPQVIPVPRLFIERERQQTQPMKQLLACWGKHPWPLVLLFVNYLCCDASRRPRPPLGPSVSGSVHSVTFRGCTEVTRTQLCFQICCLWLPAHAAPLQVISCPRGVQEDLIANRADLIAQSMPLCGFKT